MNKNDEKILSNSFSAEQLTLVKRAIVRTVQLNDNLKVAFLKIGIETNVLLYGKDLNGNTQITMLSEESFKKLKKLNLKEVK